MDLVKQILCFPVKVAIVIIMTGSVQDAIIRSRRSC